ncbi:hypothetical protein E4U53_004942, partial [Claviceps sorghi]
RAGHDGTLPFNRASSGPVSVPSDATCGLVASRTIQQPKPTPSDGPLSAPVKHDARRLVTKPVFVYYLPKSSLSYSALYYPNTQATPEWTGELLSRVLQK